MEDRAPAAPVSQQERPQQQPAPSSSNRHFAGRGAWVLTAYGISGLALFGLIAYFFSDFIAH